MSDGRGRSNVSLSTSTKNIFEAPFVLARAVLPSRLVLHQLINWHAIIPQLPFVPGLPPLLLVLWVFLQRARADQHTEDTPACTCPVYLLRTSHCAAALVYVIRTSWPSRVVFEIRNDRDRHRKAQSGRFSCEISSLY